MPLTSRLHQFGPAAESLSIDDLPVREPGPGCLAIEMLAAPVNPADLNVIEGKYGELPELPSPIGNEGVGIVTACGPGVDHVKPGTMVLPMAFGTWAQQMIVEAAGVVSLPPGIDPLQAAMLTVNPATAWRILHDFVKLEQGDWIVQNAANSGVGRSVIQLARSLGFRTLNIVRRDSLIAELKALGADVVVTEECELRKEGRSLTGGLKPKLGLNSVGGASALNVANSLAKGGSLVTFGAMSKQALKIPNGLLIFSDIRFRGFWLKRWRESASSEERTAMYASLAEAISQGVLRTPIHALHPLRDLLSAVHEAGQDQRAGKVLLDLRPDA